MLPRSDTFDAALASSHNPYVKAVVIDGDTGAETELPLAEGSAITLEGDAATRASLSLTVPIEDSELIPDDAEDALAPYGNEIVVEAGGVTPAGVLERVQMGVFRVDDVNVSGEPGEQTIEISAFDRSARIIDAVFEEAGTVEKGTNALDAAKSVIQQAYPDTQFDFVTSSVTLPLLSFEAEDDRWDFAQGCAEAAGCLLYFNNLGVCVAKPQTQGLGYDLSVSEGEGGILLSARKSWSRENATNRVVTYGENSSDQVVSGEAMDLDPDSPTYYFGKFGKCTFSYSSEYITEDDQAQDVANNILELRRGVGKSIDFGSLPNYALEPYDRIMVVRESLKMNEVHIVDSLTVPLDGSGEMSGTTRLARAF